MKKAKVGDTIVITDKPNDELRYNNGDSGVVTKVAETLDGVFADFIGVGRCFVLETEYEVVASRKAEKGDRIRIVNKTRSESRYENGDEFIVEDSQRLYVSIAPSGFAVYHSEYIILPNEEESEPKAVEANGITAGCDLTGDQLAAHSITADKLTGGVFSTPPGFVQTIGTGQTTTLRHDLPSDTVNSPSHYTQGKFEVIEVIEEWTKGYPKGYVAYCVGNALKYIARAPFKHSDGGLEDLQKAAKYLEFAIEHMKGSDRS